MTSIDERAPITLDYLKGKRRAEKALGFLTSVGTELLACETLTDAATTVVEHLARFQADLCVIDFRPTSGPALSATGTAPDLEERGLDVEPVAAHCKTEAEGLTPAAGRLEHHSAPYTLGSTACPVQVFAMAHPDGAGTLAVARVRPDAADFTDAENHLVADVAGRFFLAARCLSD